MMPTSISCRAVPPAALALLLAVFSISPAAESWYYTLGESRANQQANFCATRGEVAEIANIFRKYGVRPGFSALSASPHCELRVDTFTPLEIVEEVDVITKGAEHEYTITFVRVEIHNGDHSYVVTTREVRAAP